MSKIKVAFPHLGSYCVPIELLFTIGMETEYIVPPPVTKRTLELGSKYSPDYVCAPFKYCLGNYIESIESGANTLVQTGGVCRLGYYGELQEQILKDLGYQIRFVNITGSGYIKALGFYNDLREINPDMSIKKVANILPVVLKTVECIDEAEDYIRKNVGFEKVLGSFDKIHSEYLEKLRHIETKKELKHIHSKYMKSLGKVEVKTPDNPLKVGIVGEYYTIMEPFSNHYMEKELAQMGIVVDRWMNLTNSILKNKKKEIKEKIKNYSKYNMGATAMATIGKTLEFAKKGYDGIIHVKSFGCTPETDAIPALQNISKDYKIPILYFSFDTQTGHTGINTRLEAFYDMILMRKESMKNESVSWT